MSTALPFLEGPAFSGSEGVGGGTPKKIDKAVIELLLQGDGLKNAILNYVRTLQVDQVSDPLTRSTFQRMLRDGALQKDISTPKNYTFGTSCKDAYSDEVPASAKIGDIGGEICFDVEKLAQDYAALSSEEMMIRLASLAIHEHVHHFQQLSNSPSENEDEAYRVSAYLQLTAKIEQIPLLKWSLESQTLNLINETLLANPFLGHVPGFDCDYESYYQVSLAPSGWLTATQYKRTTGGDVTSGCRVNDEFEVQWVTHFLLRQVKSVSLMGVEIGQEFDRGVGVVLNCAQDTLCIMNPKGTLLSNATVVGVAPNPEAVSLLLKALNHLIQTVERTNSSKSEF